MAEVPLNVRALVQEREQARAAKDFTLADKLREKIADFGYDVLDGAAGSTLTPRAATGAALPARRPRAGDAHARPVPRACRGGWSAPRAQRT